jgi:DNA-binding protein HU-beta
MNKQDLVAEIARLLPNVPKTKVSRAVSALLSTISEALSRGEKVTLLGFGTFYLGQRKAKKGVHPKTKQPIVIPAAAVVKFRPGKELKKGVR